MLSVVAGTQQGNVCMTVIANGGVDIFCNPDIGWHGVCIIEPDTGVRHMSRAIDPALFDMGEQMRKRTINVLELLCV